MSSLSLFGVLSKLENRPGNRKLIAGCPTSWHDGQSNPSPHPALWHRWHCLGKYHKHLWPEQATAVPWSSRERRDASVTDLSDRKPQQVRLANGRFQVELKALCQYSGFLSIFSVYCPVEVVS